MAKTVRRGSIYEEDLAKNTGSGSATASRTTSTGGSQTLTKLGAGDPWYFANINNILFVDGVKHATIQAALTGAGAAAALVWVPTSASGSAGDFSGVTITRTDQFVLDFRGGGLIIAAKNASDNTLVPYYKFESDAGASSNFGRLSVFSEIRPIGGIEDASGISLPNGHDLALHAAGPADVRLKNVVEDTTSTTTVGGAGTQNITVGSTADLYESASIIIEPGGTNEEIITSANWSIVDSTTINATFTLAHTQPYTVRQEGAVIFDTHDILLNPDSVYAYTQLRSGNLVTIWRLPDNTSGSFPNSAIQQNATLTGMNGANNDLLFRNSASTSSWFFTSADGTATLWKLSESSNAPILTLGNATNTSFKLTANADLPRLFGGGTSGGLIFYSSQGGTGTSGIFRFRNNETDNTELFRVGTTGKLISYNSIATVSGGVPAEYATVDLTAQTAAITTTTLYAVPASGAGQYRVSWNAKVTTAATTGAATSTLGALTIVYTDPDGVVQTITAPASVAAGTIATSSTGNSTTTVLLGLPLTLNCKESTNITYAMAYASDTAAQMAYNLHIKLEAL